MSETPPKTTTTYDAVETAIKLSKTPGTWEELVRAKGPKPWASETKSSLGDCAPSPAVNAGSRP